jgi:hypothetical protein
MGLVRDGYPSREVLSAKNFPSTGSIRSCQLRDLIETLIERKVFAHHEGSFSRFNG